MPKIRKLIRPMSKNPKMNSQNAQNPKINSPNVQNLKMNSQNTQNPKISSPNVQNPEIHLNQIGSLPDWCQIGSSNRAYRAIGLMIARLA